MLSEQNEILTPNAAVTSSGRTFIDLANGKRTLGLYFRFRQTVTVAVAPLTNLRNRGSLLSQFTKIGLNDNGRDVVNIDARAAQVIGQAHSARVLTSTRLATPIAVYNLEEIVYLPLANPLSVSPSETAFTEVNPFTRLRAFVTWVPDATLIANNAGGSTLTLGTPTVEVIQNYDSDRGAVLSLLSPYYREIVAPIATANATLRTLFDSGLRLRGMLIQQDSNIGEVTDIISSFRLLGDQATFIGPQQVTYANQQQQSETQFAGDLALTSGYLFVNFQRGGRLSNVINQAAIANLRMESNVTPSVTAGVTSSNLRITLLELESLKGITEDPAAWRFRS